ncbi:MAG TPA: DNA alkylation repair protein [Candidatus Krumholzibacterium sp.]|nr:DNA alkylation repair protein [Candidatus Krumholzibacterium sp.]
MKKETRETIRAIEALGDPVTAAHSQRFFKTGIGEYGEGDLFLGIRVPVIRAEARKFLRRRAEAQADRAGKAAGRRQTDRAGKAAGRTQADMADLDIALELLSSKWHEIRLFALLVMVEKYAKGDEDLRKEIYEAYLANAYRVDNWDLVDLSAYRIVGPWLEGRSRRPLYVLAGSDDLWERRIAIMSTFHFIRKNDFTDALAIAEILLRDGHDLIHKAVGWMLREVGNRDGAAEREFLGRHYRDMPRTMLRYAIERFPEKERITWLKGEV